MIAAMDPVCRVVERARINLSTEKAAQANIAAALLAAGTPFVREHRLSGRDIVDLFAQGIGIEVKISGSARAIFRQLERYAEHDDIRGLILATNRAMSLPSTINGKPAIVASLGRGWL